MRTIDELEWFVVLAETEHMTHAAQTLSVAQPTLSRALGRLERQVGAPLFDRVNRRLRLNRFGEVMLAHARRSLAELTAAQERIATLRDPEHGTVRLAFLHSIAAWLTPEVLRGFRAQAPGSRSTSRRPQGTRSSNICWRVGWTSGSRHPARTMTSWPGPVCTASSCVLRCPPTIRWPSGTGSVWSMPAGSRS